MVGWYDPKTLFLSGFLAAVSWLFGRYADRRVIAAIGGSPQQAFDYSRIDGRLDGDFWFDYVSDIGDGWNPTYAIAHQVAQPVLDLTAPDGTTHHLPRGRVLLFGGDQVYSYPTRNAYERQAEVPYKVALRGSDSPPSPASFAGRTADLRVAGRSRRAATTRSSFQPTGGCSRSICSSVAILTNRR
jgi:hypothetical protein